MEFPGKPAQILHIQVDSILLRQQSPNTMSGKATLINTGFIQLPDELFCKTWMRNFELHRGFWQCLIQGCCAGRSENTLSCDQLRLWDMHVRTRKACPTGHVMDLWQGNTLWLWWKLAEDSNEKAHSNLCSSELLVRIWGLSSHNNAVNIPR